MKNWIIGGLIAATGITATLLAFGGPYENEYGWRGPYDYRNALPRQDVAPVQLPAYREECGSCHFAYQPGLLPEASWRGIMDGLANHFGENAELDKKTAGELRAYLYANAADRVGTGRSPGIANSLRGSAPLRITETTYFRRHHHEIPPRVVQDNPEIGSFSRCDACHTGAGDGNYDEHGVRIPGYGRWED
jgi:Dihaem cytochrome c